MLFLPGCKFSVSHIPLLHGLGNDGPLSFMIPATRQTSEGVGKFKVYRSAIEFGNKNKKLIFQFTTIPWTKLILCCLKFCDL